MRRKLDTSKKGEGLAMGDLRFFRRAGDGRKAPWWCRLGWLGLTRSW